VKSRARVSEVRYNWLADGPGGTASYELEFPEGGDAQVVGNLIAQSATTDNPAIVSYGAEHGRWPANRLQLSHNTLINDGDKPGQFARVVRAPARRRPREHAQQPAGRAGQLRRGDARRPPGNARLPAGASDSPGPAAPVPSADDIGLAPARIPLPGRHPAAGQPAALAARRLPDAAGP
jgi:hypothetical protein